MASSFRTVRTRLLFAHAKSCHFTHTLRFRTCFFWEQPMEGGTMKRLIVLGLLTLFTASCWPTPAEQAARDKSVPKSIQCMWAGDCSN